MKDKKDLNWISIESNALGKLLVHMATWTALRQTIHFCWFTQTRGVVSRSRIVSSLVALYYNILLVFNGILKIGIVNSRYFVIKKWKQSIFLCVADLVERFPELECLFQNGIIIYKCFLKHSIQVQLHVHSFICMILQNKSLLERSWMLGECQLLGRRERKRKRLLKGPKFSRILKTWSLIWQLKIV